MPSMWTRRGFIALSVALAVGLVGCKSRQSGTGGQASSGAADQPADTVASDTSTTGTNGNDASVVGGVDLARAIRFVRAHWRDYGLPSSQHIAIGGYSAGGILCGESILNQGGFHSPAELDAIDASVGACAMIYSFYGRLAAAETRAKVLCANTVPPTYFCYGTEDPFYDQFEDQVDLMHKIGHTVRVRVLRGWPHGFGAEGGWVPEFDQFMQDAFAKA